MSKWSEAPQVEEIARLMIEAKFPTLADPEVTVLYLFREGPIKVRGREVWGSCRKVTGHNAYLILREVRDQDQDLLPEWLYLIEIDRDVWPTLKRVEREFLVSHELRHVQIDEKYDEEGTRSLKASIRPHDAELFFEDFEEYGARVPGLKRTARRIFESVPQLVLLGLADGEPAVNGTGEAHGDSAGVPAVTPEGVAAIRTAAEAGQTVAAGAE